MFRKVSYSSLPRTLHSPYPHATPMPIPPNQPPTVPYAKTLAQRTTIRAWHRAFHEPHEEFLSLKKIVKLEHHERMQSYLENSKRGLRQFLQKPRWQASLPHRKLMVEGLGMEFTLPFFI